MQLLKYIVLIVFFFVGIIGLQAQTDFGTWSSVSLTKAHGKMSYTAKPIVRLNQDFKNYNNASIDLIVKRKLSDRWTASFLERYWWLDDGVNRNFWFIDIAYAVPVSEKISVSQYIRWHIAQDIEIDDPNFLRWHPSMTIKTDSKIKPYIGAELFFRIDGINEPQRTRLKIGGTYSVSSNLSILMRLWREDSFNVANTRTDYIIELNVGYKL